MPIRVAIVNDYEVVVHGIASMLRSHTHRVEVVELNASSNVNAPAATGDGDRTMRLELPGGRNVLHSDHSP